MRALVTGANGHIGSNVVRELLKRGHEVVGFVRPGSDRRALEGLGVALAEGDVLDGPAVSKAAEGAEVIFHCAANFSIWAPRPGEVLRPAIEGTRNVLHAAARAGARRVVHTSSVACVGACSSPDRLLSESDWFEAPRVPYYQAKLESERLAFKLGAELGVEVVTVLPTMVVGPHDFRRTPSQAFLVELLNGTSVTVDGGTNFVSVEDVAVGQVLAAERGRPGARYILGSDNLGNLELGGLIELLTRTRPKHLRLPKWAFLGVAGLMELGAAIRGKPPALTRALVQDVLGKYAWYDLTRTRTELGFEPRPTLVTIGEAARWYARMGWLAPKVALAFEDLEQPALAAR